MSSTRASTLYLAILSAIRSEPKSAPRIAADIGSHQVAVRNALRHMRGTVVSVAGYELIRQRTSAAVWRFGVAAEPPVPPNYPLRDPAARKGREMVAFLVLVKALQDYPQSVSELSALGAGEDQAVRRALNRARELGIAYIAEWDRQRTSGPHIAHWMLGADKKDKPRPAAKSESAVWKRCRDGRNTRLQQIETMRAMAGRLPELEAA